MALEDVRIGLLEAGCSEALAGRIVDEAMTWCAERFAAGDDLRELLGAEDAPFRGEQLFDVVSGLCGPDGDPAFWRRVIAAPGAEDVLMTGVIGRMRSGDWDAVGAILTEADETMEGRLLLELVVRGVVEVLSDERDVPDEVAVALPDAVERVEQGLGPVGFRCGVLGTEAWWSVVRAAVGQWPERLEPLSGETVDPGPGSRMQVLLRRLHRRTRRGRLHRGPEFSNEMPLDNARVPIAQRWFVLADQRPDPERLWLGPRWMAQRLEAGGDLGAPFQALAWTAYWARVGLRVQDVARLMASTGWAVLDEAWARPTESGRHVPMASGALRAHYRAGWTLPVLRTAAKARLALFKRMPKWIRAVPDVAWFRLASTGFDAVPSDLAPDLMRRCLPFMVRRGRRDETDEEIADRMGIDQHPAWPEAWEWLRSLELEGELEDERRRVMARLVRARVPGWRVGR